MTSFSWCVILLSDPQEEQSSRLVRLLKARTNSAVPSIINTMAVPWASSLEISTPSLPPSIRPLAPIRIAGSIQIKIPIAMPQSSMLMMIWTMFRAAIRVLALPQDGQTMRGTGAEQEGQ
jgi:hypothetical protein